MKRLFLLAALLMACQPSQTEAPDSTGAVKVEPEPETGVKAGVVRLRLKSPVSEEFACIIPIQLENGLADDVKITMIGFTVTGPGDDASANMFAPPAAAGETSEARVIVQGQSCSAFNTLNIPDIRCTSAEESCAAKVELIDGGGVQFARTG